MPRSKALEALQEGEELATVGGLIKEAGKTFDIEIALYQAVKEAFPKAKISIEAMGPDHPKLMHRQLPAQVMVRITGLTQIGLDEHQNIKRGFPAAVATMV